MKCSSFWVIFFLSFLPVLVRGQEQPAALKRSGGGLHTLSRKVISITIDANAGSRVTSLTFRGQELLHVEDYNGNYGSALRLSPQGKWKGTEKLNKLVYQVTQRNGDDLLLTSEADSLHGFKFTNRFHLNLRDTAIEITYSITNLLNEAQQVAPWEVTRVPTGGLAFFPKGLHDDMPLTNKIRPLLTIRDSAGIIWYPYDTSQAAAQKLMMKGSEGWLAYANKGLIFIRKFPVITTAETAPEEQNVELWVNKEKTFIELENQGPYQELRYGQSLHYKVTWLVRTLPENINPQTGNDALIAFVRNVVNKKQQR